MSAGWVFILTGLYLTLAVAGVISLLEHDTAADVARNTARRWAKFLGGMAAVMAVVQALTWMA